MFAWLRTSDMKQPNLMILTMSAILEGITNLFMCRTATAYQIPIANNVSCHLKANNSCKTD